MTQILPSIIVMRKWGGGGPRTWQIKVILVFKLKHLKFDSTFLFSSLLIRLVVLCLGLDIMQGNFIYFKFILLWWF